MDSTCKNNDANRVYNAREQIVKCENNLHIFDHLLGDEQLDVPGVPEKFELKPINVGAENEQWIRIIELVSKSGQYNMELCRIKVNHRINFELLETLLTNYHDKQIIDLLKFSFPIERDMNVPLELGGINHKGATEFPEHVDAYIQKEITLGATIGPFENIPFSGPVAISPIST